MNLTDKVSLAIERLHFYEPDNGFYLAFSGGKDSVVLYDLAVKAGVKFDAHFQLTSVDPPPLVRFIRQNYKNVAVHLPKTTMKNLILKKKMLPTRKIRFCCEHLKEFGGAGRFVLTGIRSDESTARSKRGFVELFEKNKKCKQSKKIKQFLHPIFNFTTDDVWEYSKLNNLPVCELYRHPYNFNRIGCIGCPMAYFKTIKNEFATFPKFKTLYLEAITKLINEHDKFLDFDNAPDVFNWWVSGQPKEIYFAKKNQLTLWRKTDDTN